MACSFAAMRFFAVCPEHWDAPRRAISASLAGRELKTGIITIPTSKHGEKRHVPINSAARNALETLWQRRAAPGYVCHGTEGLRRRDWRRWFEEALEVAALQNFRWHDLRHTFASRLVMAGVDLRTVQELMGHKTISMTVRYSHLAPKHLQEAVERLTTKPTDTTTDTGCSEGNAQQDSTAA
jgi:site-specific recombinase XerD